MLKLKKKTKTVSSVSRPKFREDDYSYSSAKISSMAAKLPSNDFILSLCDLDSVSALKERIAEISVRSDSENADFEEILSSSLESMYSSVSAFLPDSEICSIMRARFDCHNLKTAIKCSLIGIDPKPFFMRGGEHSFNDFEKAVQNRDYSAFPDLISKAAQNASDAIKTNAQARTVDVFLDKACFDYMLMCSKSLGCNEISRLLSLKTDCTNILTRLRIENMKNRDTADIILGDSLLEGGNISIDELKKANSPESICKLLCAELNQERSRLVREAINGKAGYDVLSAVLDSIFMSEAYDICRRKLIGIYPVIEYIIRYEYMIKNIRIIAGGINSGKNADCIRAEVRAYV